MATKTVMFVLRMCSGIHYGIFSYQELPQSSSGLVWMMTPPVLIGERYCLACHSWPSTELMIHVVWLVVGWTFWVTYMNSPKWKVTSLHFGRWPCYTSSFLEIRGLTSSTAVVCCWWVVSGQAQKDTMKDPTSQAAKRKQPKKNPRGSRRFGELVMKSWRDLTSTNFCTDASWKLLEVAWKFQQLQLQLCHIPRLWQLLKLTVEVFRLCMPKSKVL